MSTIIKRWVENKLGLPLPHFEDPHLFSKFASNGYLIGEIIRKYHYISDDQSVSLRRTIKHSVRVKNFNNIWTWLKKIGYELDRDLIQDIIDEKPGAALKFLFKLYLWLEYPKCFKTSGLGRLVEKEEFCGDSNENFLNDHLKKEVKVEIREEESGECTCEENEDEEKTQRKEKVEEEYDENTVIHLPGGVIKKYTDEDIKKLPSLYEKLNPYGRLPEDSQAENLYFALKSVEILKKQNEACKRRRDPEEALKRNLKPIRYSVDLRHHDVDEIIRDAEKRISYNRKIFNDLEEYDKSASELKDEIVKDERKCEVKIYKDGMGDKDDLEKSLNLLKCKRRREILANEERIRCRKYFLNKIYNGLQNQLNNQLQDEILALTLRPSKKETLLLDFFKEFHQDERNVLIQHEIFQSSQLEKFKENILNNEMDDFQNYKDLKDIIMKNSEDFQNDLTKRLKKGRKSAEAFLKNPNIFDEIMDDLMNLSFNYLKYENEHKGDKVSPEEMVTIWKETFFKNKIENI